MYPLAEMNESSFTDLLSGARLAHQAKIEAAEKEAREKVERERLDKLETSRRVELAPYAQFMTKTFDFREMSEEHFQELRLALAEAAAEHLLEQERIKAENEKLKKEAEEKEAIRKTRNAELRPYVMFIRVFDHLLNLPEDEYKKEFAAIDQGARDHYAYEAKAKAEREAAESARLKAEREARAKLEAERKERERIEAELQAKKDAEAKAEADRMALEESEAAKGDIDKFADLVTSLTGLKTKYSFKSKKYKTKQQRVNVLIDKIIEDATK
jgi:hypothetical protein